MNATSLIRTNLLLKLFSLLAGTLLWYIISSSHVISMNYTVPLCFYGNTEHITITAPETITITLAGKRSDLRALQLNELALHINADELGWGEQPLEPTTQKLFLPSSIKLVQWKPTNLSITVEAPQEPEKLS
jgi:hypothetical protein